MGVPPVEPLDGGGPPSPVPPGSPPRRRLPPRLEGSDSLPLPDFDSGARSSDLPVRPAPPSLLVEPLLRLPMGEEGTGEVGLSSLTLASPAHFSLSSLVPLHYTLKTWLYWYLGVTYPHCAGCWHCPHHRCRRKAHGRVGAGGYRGVGLGIGRRR